MLMEHFGFVHQHISGTSQQNSIAAFPFTTEADGDLLKTIEKKTSNSSIQLIQLDVSPQKP